MPRPVRKFVSWKSLDKRLAENRIKLTWSEMEPPEHAKRIFSTAQALLDDVEPNAKFIFPGTGMRPLFEAVRALNETDPRMPRKNIIYVVGPRIPIPHGDEPIQAIQRLLEKKVKRNQDFYVVIDREDTRKTLHAYVNAIRGLNPNARVEVITHNHPEYGKGIEASDDFLRPTLKRNDGTLEPADSFKRKEYVHYQKLLQDHVKKVASHNKGKILTPNVRRAIRKIARNIQKKD